MLWKSIRNHTNEPNSRIDYWGGQPTREFVPGPRCDDSLPLQCLFGWLRRNPKVRVMLTGGIRKTKLYQTTLKTNHLWLT